jgi:hypothetical protein
MMRPMTALHLSQRAGIQPRRSVGDPPVVGDHPSRIRPLEHKDQDSGDGNDDPGDNFIRDCGGIHGGDRRGS